MDKAARADAPQPTRRKVESRPPSLWSMLRRPPSLWRTRLYDEIDRLDDELSRLPPDEASADYRISRENAERARAIADNAFNSMRTWPAWQAVYRAREALIAIQDQQTLQAQIPDLQSSLAADPLDPSDPRSAEFHGLLADLLKKQQLDDRDRARLRGVTRAIHERQELVHDSLRGFQVAIMLVASLLYLAVVGLIIAGMYAPSVLSLCGHVATAGDAPCVNGGAPEPYDILEVALFGTFGGLISATTALRFSVVNRGPYLVYALQFLKLPLGALLAILGVMLLQRGLLGIIDPQGGSKLLAYAVLFGLGQQALTRSLDARAASIIGADKGRDSAAPPSALGGSGS